MHTIRIVSLLNDRVYPAGAVITRYSYICRGGSGGKCCSVTIDVLCQSKIRDIPYGIDVFLIIDTVRIDVLEHLSYGDVFIVNLFIAVQVGPFHLPLFENDVFIYVIYDIADDLKVV